MAGSTKPVAETAARTAQEDGAFRLDSFLPFHLAVVANQVSQSIARLIESQFGLHIPEWRILATLKQSQPVSSQALVQNTAMDPARVSRAQARLSDLGLIDVRQDPDDKRRVRVSLTEQGAQIIDAITPEAQRVEEQLLADLSAEERQHFEAALRRLYLATKRID